MTLYGKGNWTRLAVEPESFAKWQELEADERGLFMTSAFVARTALLTNRELDSTVGINPPKTPCGDSPVPLDQILLDKKVHPWIARNLSDKENTAPWEMPEGVDVPDIYEMTQGFWGDFADYFLLAEDRSIIGFWLVLHTRENLDDLNALKEHASATSFGTPFKHLSNTMKKEITASITSDGLVDHIARTQCPVILDFETGDVWIGTSTKKLIDAFKHWMSINLQVPVQACRLSIGNTASWPSLALGMFQDGDIYKLERAEALEDLIADEPEDDGEIEIEGENGLKKEEDAPEDVFHINNIAVFNTGEGTLATVYTDALIELGAGLTTITAKKPGDALAILKDVQTAKIAAARVKFSTILGGGLAEGTVDFNANLVTGAFKGLELDFNAEAVAELEINDGVESLMDSKGASKINLHWFGYYLRLRLFEHMLIDTACSALTIDPANVKLAPVVLRVREIEAKPKPQAEAATAEKKVAKPRAQKEKAEAKTDAAIMNSPEVKKAAKKLQDGMNKHLLPGESVTFSSGGKSATIHKGDDGKMHRGNPNTPPPPPTAGFQREVDIDL